MPSVRTDAYDYFAFGGGGANGFSFFGALHALTLAAGNEDFAQLHRRVRGVAGCSAGCFPALAMVLGMEPQDILRKCEELNVHQVVHEFDVNRFVNRYGLDDGKMIRQNQNLQKRIPRRFGNCADPTYSSRFRKRKKILP